MNADDFLSLWYDVPWLLVLSIMLFLLLPSSKNAAGTMARLGMIDWIGVAVSVAAVVLLLVSIFHAVVVFQAELNCKDTHIPRRLSLCME